MSITKKKKVSLKRVLFMWGLCACCAINSIDFGYATGALRRLFRGKDKLTPEQISQLSQEEINRNPEIAPTKDRVILSLADGRRLGYGDPGLKQIDGHVIWRAILGEIVSDTKAFKDYAQVITLFVPASVTSISGFSGYDDLEAVIFERESKLEAIEWRTFMDCCSLRAIIIPPSVEFIGVGAFLGCSGLENVTFEDGSVIRQIRYDAFKGCKSLNDIHLPPGLESIGSSAFRNCRSLNDIHLPPGLKSIGNNAFSRTGNGTIVIPANVSDVGKAFKESKFSSIIFEEGSKVKNLEYEAFRDCSELTNIRLPQELETIEEHAFSGTPLNSLTIPGSVRLERAFFEKTENLDAISFLEYIFGNSYDRNPKISAGCVVSFAGDPPQRFEYDEHTTRWKEKKY